MLEKSLSAFAGTKIITSDQACEMVPIFPDKPRTKRRLRRTRGKFGCTDRLNPLAYQTPFGLVVHPQIAAELRRQFALT